MSPAKPLATSRDPARTRLLTRFGPQSAEVVPSALHPCPHDVPSRLARSPAIRCQPAVRRRTIICHGDADSFCHGAELHRRRRLPPPTELLPVSFSTGRQSGGLIDVALVAPPHVEQTRSRRRRGLIGATRGSIAINLPTDPRPKRHDAAARLMQRSISDPAPVRSTPGRRCFVADCAPLPPSARNTPPTPPPVCIAAAN